MESDRAAGSPSVERSAQEELARLQALEDDVWHDPERIRTPKSIRLMIAVVGLVLLTSTGLLWSRVDHPLAFPLGVVLCVGFVAIVIALERRYSTARTATIFPPRQIFQQQVKSLLLPIGLPIGLGAGVGFNLAIERQAPWWVFSVLVVAMWTASIAIFVLQRRFAPVVT